MEDKMKNLLTVVMVLVFGVMAFGQAPDTKNQLHGNVELEIEVRDGIATPQVKSYFTFGGKTKVGLYCWVQNSENFNQVYCGPTYKVAPWLVVSFAAGVKTDAQHFQASFSVWTGKLIEGKMVQNLFIFEKGSHWYRNVSSVDINKRFTASLVTQRYSGTGPRLDIKLANGFSVGVEANFNKNSTAKVGLKYSF
jgi:hypothetical protein